MLARFAEIAIGIFLILLPELFGVLGFAAANLVVCGALAASASIVALSEATRGLRRVNLLIGPWTLISALFMLDGLQAAAAAAAGISLAALSFAGGHIRSRLGGGWRMLMSTRREIEK